MGETHADQCYRYADVGLVRLRSSLALFSYCDVRIQSNPYVLKGDKSVLKRAIVRLLGGGVRSNEYRISK